MTPTYVVAFWILILYSHVVFLSANSNVSGPLRKLLISGISLTPSCPTSNCHNNQTLKLTFSSSTKATKNSIQGTPAATTIKSESRTIPPIKSRSFSTSHTLSSTLMCKMRHFKKWTSLNCKWRNVSRRKVLRLSAKRSSRSKRVAFCVGLNLHRFRILSNT